MWQLFIGSLALSIIHALIPNHWIPLIAISKAEKWKMGETMFATFITAFFHLLSTIIIGVLIGFLGIKIFESYEHISHFAAPIILIGLGITYLILDYRGKTHHNHEPVIKDKKSKSAIITSLAIGMFFSPCIELEAYYFQAASFGTMGIFIVSMVYLIITLTLIMSLVYLGLKGMNRLSSQLMQYHAKRITGIVLIVLGTIGYFVEF